MASLTPLGRRKWAASQSRRESQDEAQKPSATAALACAAGKGWRGDVINVFNDPGPGIITPTFWEMYMNNSEWVVDIFVNRLVAEVSRE
jgi:hypothetical protein